VTVDEVEVREPSLSAANTAVELLRKLGGFGKDQAEGVDGGTRRIEVAFVAPGAHGHDHATQDA
jgi:hypothetical protein